MEHLRIPELNYASIKELHLSKLTGKERETMTDSTKVTAAAASLPNSVGDLTAQELQGLIYLH